MSIKILYLNPYLVTGETTGGKLRSFHVGLALKRIGYVKCIIGRISKINTNDIDAALGLFDEVETIQLIESRNNFVLNYLRRNFLFGIYGAHGYKCDDKTKLKIRNDISRFDIVWFHGSLIPSALSIKTKRKIFIDIDDLYSQLFYYEAFEETEKIRRIKLFLRSKVWKIREKKIVREFGGVGLCSAADDKYLGSFPSISIIPNGFDKPRNMPKRKPSLPPKIGFMGNFKMRPNSDGANWFISCVWKKIKSEIPDVKLMLIGAGRENIQKGEHTDIETLGYLDEPSNEIASWSLMIVPIFVGGGTRVKIADAFSRMCPVVATRLGAYGYDVADGAELLLADTPDEFASKCIRLLKNPEEGERLAEAAWEKFLKEYTWDSIYPKVESAVAAILDNNKIAY